MRSIFRYAMLLALVVAFAGCTGGMVRERGRTTTIAAGATTSAPVRQSEAPTVANEKKKEEMAVAERILFDVYRRGGKYYATVAMERPGVDWVSLREVIPVEPTVESIAATLRAVEPRIRKLFAEAAEPATNNYVDDDEKYWERMGAKNRKQFMRTTSFCNVDLRSDQITIWYMLHDPQINLFGSIDEGPNAKLPPDTSYEDIARAVIEIFEKNPPPAGDKPPASKRPRKTTAKE